MSSSPSTFREIDLSESMHEALDAAGYREPTPIQAAAIPPALRGCDIVGSAQTGTGKTAAFLVPLIERLRSSDDAALILAPTRELAEQIHEWAVRLGGGLRTALIVGGMAYGPQIDALRGKPSIVVATPGRLLDHMDRRVMRPGSVRILVLDEADRMLDMGFRPQLERILRALPKGRQTMLFSATLPPEVASLAHGHLQDPVRVEAGPQAAPPERVTQDVYVIGQLRKPALLLSLVEEHPGSFLVFTRTKHATDRLAQQIQRAGHSVQKLHSGCSQPMRRQALEGFRNGRYRILIATDIAARGIDVDGIDRVVNYDLPETVDDYLHRIGRTARAEAHGHASSFADARELPHLHAIERYLGGALPRRSFKGNRGETGEYTRVSA